MRIGMGCSANLMPRLPCCGEIFRGPCAWLARAHLRDASYVALTASSVPLPATRAELMLAFCANGVVLNCIWLRPVALADLATIAEAIVGGVALAFSQPPIFWSAGALRPGHSSWSLSLPIGLNHNIRPCRTSPSLVALVTRSASHRTGQHSVHHGTVGAIAPGPRTGVVIAVRRGSQQNARST